MVYERAMIKNYYNQINRHAMETKLNYVTMNK